MVLDMVLDTERLGMDGTAQAIVAELSGVMLAELRQLLITEGT